MTNPETKRENYNVGSSAGSAGSRNASRMENVFSYWGDIGVFGGAFCLAKVCWKNLDQMRVRDTPISEAGIAGACVGCCITGNASSR